MSGGFFEYKQFHIDDIACRIEEELENTEMFVGTYSHEAEEKMKEAVKQLRIAAVYAGRVDWFLSGDDDEEYFVKQLEEDLNNL